MFALKGKRPAIRCFKSRNWKRPNCIVAVCGRFRGALVYGRGLWQLALQMGEYTQAKGVLPMNWDRFVGANWGSPLISDRGRSSTIAHCPELGIVTLARSQYVWARFMVPMYTRKGK
jgi:hypothetical protein